MDLFFNIAWSVRSAFAAYKQLKRGVSVEAVIYSIEQADTLIHDPATEQPGWWLDSDYQPF